MTLVVDSLNSDVVLLHMKTLQPDLMEMIVLMIATIVTLDVAQIILHIKNLKMILVVGLLDNQGVVMTEKLQNLVHHLVEVNLDVAMMDLQEEDGLMINVVMYQNSDVVLTIKQLKQLLMERTVVVKNGNSDVVHKKDLKPNLEIVLMITVVDCQNTDVARKTTKLGRLM